MGGLQGLREKWNKKISGPGFSNFCWAVLQEDSITLGGGGEGKVQVEKKKKKFKGPSVLLVTWAKKCYLGTTICITGGAVRKRPYLFPKKKGKKVGECERSRSA